MHSMSHMLCCIIRLVCVIKAQKTLFLNLVCLHVQLSLCPILLIGPDPKLILAFEHHNDEKFKKIWLFNLKVRNIVWWLPRTGDIHHGHKQSSHSDPKAAYHSINNVQTEKKLYTNPTHAYELWCAFHIYRSPCHFSCFREIYHLTMNY